MPLPDRLQNIGQAEHPSQFRVHTRPQRGNPIHPERNYLRYSLTGELKGGTRIIATDSTEHPIFRRFSPDSVEVRKIAEELEVHNLEFTELNSGTIQAADERSGNVAEEYLRRNRLSRVTRIG